MGPRILPDALQDLDEIWNFIAADDAAAADRMVERFLDAAELLAANPKMGPARDELRKGLRSFPVGNYLLFYRPVTGRIEVLRVLHGQRNLKNEL